MARRKVLWFLVPSCLILLAFFPPVSHPQAEKGKIAFVANVEGNWDLFVMDGGDLKQLTHTPFDEQSPALSPDRRQIAYASSDGTIGVIGVDGKGARRLNLPKGTYNHPAWSPDSRSLIFVAYTFWGIEWEEGDLVRYDLQDDTLDTSWKQTGVQVYPVFLKDEAIIYSVTIAGPLNQVIHQLWSYSPVTKRAHQILLTRHNDLQPDVSPGGDLIVFASDRSGNYDLWIVDVDGTHLRQLTTDPAAEMDPVFSPDGKKVLFTSDRSGILELWLMDIETMKVNKLSPFGDKKIEIRSPSWR